jgi:hypothetical protein
MKARMPITPFLRGRAFDPETVVAMSRAFRSACRALGLRDRDDALNKMVAEYVINLAQTGVITPTALYMLTVMEFKGNQAQSIPPKPAKSVETKSSSKLQKRHHTPADLALRFPHRRTARQDHPRDIALGNSSRRVPK